MESNGENLVWEKIGSPDFSTAIHHYHSNLQLVWTNSDPILVTRWLFVTFLIRWVRCKNVAEGLAEEESRCGQ